VLANKAKECRWRLSRRWAWPLAACLSLAGWYAFFGGFGPAAEIARQAIPTVRWMDAFPEHALYLLTCLGAYYVLPEAVLYRGSTAWRLPGRPALLLLAGGLLGLFLLFPPLNNAVALPTKGFLDRFVRTFAPDWLRMAIFYGLALAALLRFTRGFPLLLVVVNAGMMMKAHIAWDKYALPLLVVLWYLRSREEPAQAETGSPPPAGAPPARAAEVRP
jgi:hypothetical protein